jgi:hypothetical protein
VPQQKKRQSLRLSSHPPHNFAEVVNEQIVPADHASTAGTSAVPPEVDGENIQRVRGDQILGDMGIRAAMFSKSVSDDDDRSGSGRSPPSSS